MASNIHQTLEDLVECLCNLNNETTQAIDDPPFDGEVATGPDEQFPTLSEYEVAKCNAANGIYDTVKGIVNWLKVNNVDLLAGLFGGVTSGLLIGLALAGPVGWAVAITGGIMGGVAAFLIKFAINFTDLESAITEQHEEAVQVLFEAGSTTQAKANFIAVIDDATTPITPIEVSLLQLIISSTMINQLFEPRSDLATYVSPDPVDCTAFCSRIHLEFGIEITENVFQSLEIPEDNNWAVVIRVWSDGSAGCGDDVPQDVEITDLAGWSDYSGDPGNDQSFRYSTAVGGGGTGCTGWDVYCSDTEPVGTLECRNVNIRSDTEFTVTFEVTEP